MGLGRKVVSLFLTLSLVTIIFGVLLIVFHPRIVKYQLSSDLILKEGSPAVQLWSQRPNFPIYYHVHFFNYSMDLQNHTIAGPYKFAFRKEKVNITFNGVDQVIYTEVKTYDLMETGKYSMDDKITTHDPSTYSLLETTIGDMMQSFFPNNTETSFVVKSGYANIEYTGFVINVNGTALYENKFYGYNVGPNVKQSSLIYVFDADFCITNLFHYVASHAVNGTSVLRFMHESRDRPGPESCARKIPYDIIETGQDQLHMPSYFDVEPYTGWIMKAAFRRQIRSKTTETSPPKTILQYEEAAEADEETSDHVDDFVFHKVRVINSVAGYFVLAGVVMLLILLTAFLRSKRANAEVTTPVDLAPESVFKL